MANALEQGFEDHQHLLLGHPNYSQSNTHNTNSTNISKDVETLYSDFVEELAEKGMLSDEQYNVMGKLLMGIKDKDEKKSEIHQDEVRNIRKKYDRMKRKYEEWQEERARLTAQLTRRQNEIIELKKANLKIGSPMPWLDKRCGKCGDLKGRKAVFAGSASRFNDGQRYKLCDSRHCNHRRNVAYGAQLDESSSGSDTDDWLGL